MLNNVLLIPVVSVLTHPKSRQNLYNGIGKGHRLSPQEDLALISFYLTSERALCLLSFPKMYKVKLRSDSTMMSMMQEEPLAIRGAVLKRLTTHVDERGFFMELIRQTDPFFEEGFAQLSYSKIYQGIVKAWHIHKTQIDWWFVQIGRLKVALSDQRPDSPSFGKTITLFLGEDVEPAVLKIPAGVAHGCKAIGGTAHLFYITSSVYKLEEEGRIPHDDPTIGYDWVSGVEIK